MLLSVLSVLASACASAPQPLPLRPEPIPWADTLPIPEPPGQDEQRYLRAFLFHVPYEMAEPFRVPEGEALDLTHFDDAVSSAWWVRRMGYRDISPGELAAGPTSAAGAPAAEGPLVVVDGKAEGTTPGFVMEDAKGDTYITKLDPAEYMHLQSAAGTITNRLMWGAGYHVPEDYLVVFERDRLVVGEDAVFEEGGEERPMTAADVDAILSNTGTLADGRLVALASKYVPGVPKGPFFFHGRRDDDPNDHYRHEYRRDLRGLRVVSSWVNNTDLREGNTLDVFVEPGYLRHYVIDFGATLGSGSTRPKHPKDAVEQPAAPWPFLARFLTLGLYEGGWEDEPWQPIAPALGFIRSEAFDPAGWNAQWENPAFFAMTPADAYWAAKIVGAFTDAHIRAAVEAGGLPERRLVDTLTSILATRRDRLVRHWFGQVTPIEAPAAASQGPGRLDLSFRDLGLEMAGFAAEGTEYRWTLEHDARDIDVSGRAPASAGRVGAQLVPVEWPPDGADAAGALARGDVLEGEDALAELTLRAVRPGVSGRGARVWLRWDGQRYAVVGLEH